MQQQPIDSHSSDRVFKADSDLEKYCVRPIENGATHVKQVHPGTVITAAWVQWKCRYGCPGYGRGHCCPPRTPDHDQTRAMLDSYSRALLIHTEVPDMPEKDKYNHKVYDSIVGLEGDLFKDGYYRAFAFLAGPCKLCEKCAALDENPCVQSGKARPSMEGCGIDVYQTARNNGFFVKPLREKTETNNKYCLVMVD